jgi:trehalose-6-phosphatase
MRASPLRRLPPPQLAWAYCLDMDGTLSGIAARPDAARMDQPLLALVQVCHRC